MNVIEVDLFATDEISARSLDSLVINNSDLATSGRGIDAIDLLAYSRLEIDNLRFSEQIKSITMEAQTIDLSNLNFPQGSVVQLNSLKGGLDGRYPNFNSSLLGRVNFLRNISYAKNLIMNRASFDQYAGNSIKIGTLGR